jgi:hypothetical protein
MASGADRQRRYRARRRKGLMSLRAVAVPDDWGLTLADAGLIGPDQVDDPDAIRIATERFIARVRISTLQPQKV